MALLLPKPILKRSAATAPLRQSFFDATPDEARSSPEAARIRTTVMTAYKNLGFTGPAFALPSGRVVTEDLWESALEVALDDTADYGLDALRDFSLERWLSAKVHAEGNTDQRARLEELLQSLDVPAEPVDEYCAGLPVDFADVMHQPLQEVEVYRGLDDLVPEDVVHSGALPPDDDQDADVPEDGDAEDAA